CLADYVDIAVQRVDGTREFVGRFCGDHKPKPFLAIHPQVEIIFHADLAEQSSGFLGTYEFIEEEIIPAPVSKTRGHAGCGGTLSGVGGTLVSPSFPHSFPANVDCLWLIRVQRGRQVLIKMTDLQLLGSIASCQEAEVSVYDGYGSLEWQRGSAKVMSYCGSLGYFKNPGDKVVVSQRNRLIVRFRTTQRSRVAQSPLAGFRLVWTEVELLPVENCTASGRLPCLDSQFCIDAHSSSAKPCQNVSNYCIHPTLRCDGQSNCSEEDYSDELQCEFLLNKTGKKQLISASAQISLASTTSTVSSLFALLRFASYATQSKKMENMRLVPAVVFLVVRQPTLRCDGQSNCSEEDYSDELQCEFLLNKTGKKQLVN
ncbi:unnamed protein product, partial [Cyprideis torosa]